MQTENQTPVRSNSVINRSAVKCYALGVSGKHRAGKFERVSGEFLDAVEAEVEATIRRMTASESAHGTPDEAPALSFTTKHARERMIEKLEEATRSIVFKKVMRHPSVGCTLKD